MTHGELSTLCPACGFDLEEPAWIGGSPSNEICVSCGLQFGLEDMHTQGVRDHVFYESWRSRWLLEGAKWWSASRKAPEGWVPTEQVQRLVSEARFDAVFASGNIDVAVRITDNGADTPAKVSASEGVNSSIIDGVLRLVAEPVPIDESERTAASTITVEVASLSRVHVQSGATVVLSGTLDQLKIEALNYGTIDATALTLRTASVGLELSAVSICVTEMVSGYVVYLSELTVIGGGDVSHVSTANGGRLV